MKEPRGIIKRPVITEKSSNLRDADWYVFSVDRKANRKEIKDAIETKSKPDTSVFPLLLAIDSRLGEISDFSNRISGPEGHFPIINLLKEKLDIQRKIISSLQSNNVEEASGIKINIPSTLSSIMEAEKKSVNMKASSELFKNFLLD